MIELINRRVVVRTYSAGMHFGTIIYKDGQEVMLKAKICERLGIPNLYDESDKNTNSIAGIGELRKTLKTHNLFILLIVSGLKNRFDQDKAKNINLAKANSLLFSNWDENARYKPCGHMKDKDVETLINLLSDNTGILKWIEQN